jgi:hypothetical protein
MLAPRTVWIRVAAIIAMVVIVMAVGSLRANAHNYMTKEEIAKLPSEKVAVIKRMCAQRWADNFEMRLYCEDEQYQSLQILLERDR